MLEAFLIASSLSLDAFVAGFAYGANKIKINFLSVQIINIICSSMTGLSFILGDILKNYIPQTAASIVCFAILFLLALTKLLDGFTKSFIKKHNNLSRELKFSLFNFNFILKLYAVPEDSDADRSKTISPMEAVSIAAALSLDGAAVGFGAALGGANGLAVFLFSLATNMLALILGRYTGEKAARKIKFNLSWLGGAVLMILAFSKLV